MPWSDTNTIRLRRVFLEGFSVIDVAEPLISFDAEADARTVHAFMVEKDFDLVGVRKDGLVAGYVNQQDLSGGLCGDVMQPFTQDDVIPDISTLVDAVKSLAVNERCFVTILERVGAIATLSDLEKPPMRMFLFGMITLGEMVMTQIIRHQYLDGSWQQHISEGRLAKAMQLQKERARRGQNVDLVDCLQYGDKGWILSYNEDIRKALGQESRRKMREAIKEIETLRNNLAHNQPIIPTSWQRIVIACSRLELNLEVFTERLDMLKKLRSEGETPGTN